MDNLKIYKHWRYRFSPAVLWAKAIVVAQRIKRWGWEITQPKNAEDATQNFENELHQEFPEIKDEAPKQ